MVNLRAPGACSPGAMDRSPDCSEPQVSSLCNPFIQQHPLWTTVGQAHPWWIRPTPLTLRNSQSSRKTATTLHLTIWQRLLFYSTHISSLDPSPNLMRWIILLETLLLSSFYGGESWSTEWLSSLKRLVKGKPRWSGFRVCPVNHHLIVLQYVLTKQSSMLLRLDQGAEQLILTYLKRVKKGIRHDYVRILAKKNE